MRTLCLAVDSPLPSHCVLHGVSSVCVLKERVLFLFLEGHQLYQIRTPPLLPHLFIIPSLMALSLNIVTLRVLASTYECGWGWWRMTKLRP